MSVRRPELVRYGVAATSARLFGLTRGTRALYRALGNRFSQEGHSEVFAAAGLHTKTRTDGQPRC